MSRLKEFARDWLPPVVVRLVQKRRSSGLCFEGNFASWEEANANCTGYDAQDILDKVLAATLKVKHGEAVFERDSVLFDEIKYSWPVLSGLMWGAARNSGKLNVLDFGGALGSGYYQNRKFLQSLPEVRWNVVEQPHYVEAGRKYIEDEQLRFYKTIKECLVENYPNVILLSSVMQYLPNPFDTLSDLCKINADTLIFDRTSFSLTNQDTIRLQHVPADICEAIYPCHTFSEDNFRKLVSEEGYQLLESFNSLDAFDPDTYWCGHIFSRQNL
jgi:putative methyltransferase (TIGR04325 family)